MSQFPEKISLDCPFLAGKRTHTQHSSLGWLRDESCDPAPVGPNFAH